MGILKYMIVGLVNFDNPVQSIVDYIFWVTVVIKIVHLLMKKYR